jgi:serine/threonine protein kinase
MRLIFSVIAGPHKGRVFTFNGHDTFLVGRSSQAHFRLPADDEYISRVHFLVEVNPPHCRLLDMGSTNGTYVNGQKVALANLRDGDCIHGGQTTLRVTLDLDGAEAEDTVHRPPVSEPVTQPYVRGGQDASASDSEDQAIHLPAGYPNYQIVRKLGRGGMGIVYLATHVPSGRHVALKTIRPLVDHSPADRQRFLREARILQQLDHPHIVAFQEMGESADSLFFVMDYVPGRNAAALLQAEGPLPIGRALDIACQLLAGLSHAHECGFVHRDVKPANLMVTDAGGKDFVRILDFGLARTYQLSKLSGLSILGQVGGTVPFMAPEQITNFRASRPGVDQYAAAATLYNLLTRKYIQEFPDGLHQRFRMVLEDDAVPIRNRRPEVPGPLAESIHRALSRDPEKRFPDVASFRAALLASIPE